VILAAVGLLTVAAPQARAQDTPESEAKKLQGAWIVDAAEVQGEAFAEVRGAKVTFAGDKVTMESKERKVTGTFKVDPKAQPRQMNIAPGKETPDEPPMEGIYAWDGDKLKLLFSGNEVKETTDGSGKTVREVIPGKRPTAMDSKQGLLMTLKRQ
jgi:uncharacterized protein (TIGR03067 family)